MRIRLVVVIALLLAAAAVVAGYLLIPGAPDRNDAPDRDEPTPPPVTQSQSQSQPSAEHKPFCERDFSQVAEREADISELAAVGGLVRILQRKAAAPPWPCAQFYLAHGLDVNAIDPRGKNGLTALHYAIKQNEPKMLAFVIENGANLHKKAGKKNLQPMGYAYYLALNDTSIDRNRVIALLNAALVEAEKEAAATQ